jgi:hypothetical protein
VRAKGYVDGVGAGARTDDRSRRMRRRRVVTKEQVTGTQRRAGAHLKAWRQVSTLFHQELCRNPLLVARRVMKRSFCLGANGGRR